jgi:DNA primase
MPGLAELNPAIWPGHPALLAVDSRDALLAAAQMNTVEFHTWNSTTRSIDQPDRLIFDLDPGEGVTWAHVQEAALLMRAMLVELGLQSWVKTSGGKGLQWHALFLSALSQNREAPIASAKSSLTIYATAMHRPLPRLSLLAHDRVWVFPCLLPGRMFPA